jgi:hypothetical protein
LQAPDAIVTCSNESLTRIGGVYRQAWGMMRLSAVRQARIESLGMFFAKDA